MRSLIVPAAVIAVALLTFAVVTAQAAQLMTNPNSSGEVVVRDDIQPLALQAITQSTAPDTVVAGTSVACIDAGVTTENSWLRLFDLDGDHGLVGTFAVSSVTWATEEVVGALDLTVNVYCLDESLPFLFQFMTLKDAVVVPVADEVYGWRETDIGGSCDSATEDMAIELFAEDCNLAGCTMCYIGMNDLGQSGPSYIASTSCDVSEPTDLAGIGFPNAHLIMVVRGEDENPNDDGGCVDPPDDGGEVPSTTGVGAVLLLLVLLGSGAYFLRGRAAT
jgi:hypothetical protein